MTRRIDGAGGTPGGLGTFIAGAAMVIAGGYLLLTRVTVASGGWHFYGYNAFGLSLAPLLIGIGILFSTAVRQRAGFSRLPARSSSSLASWPTSRSIFDPARCSTRS